MFGSSEKLSVGNGEAICCFGEAIAFYDYSISSAPFVSELRLRFESSISFEKFLVVDGWVGGWVS